MDEFLVRINECKTASVLKDDELLRALPLLLVQPALNFYRNKQDTWRNWRDFERDLKSQYQHALYSERLLDQIRERKQGQNEPMHDYINAMLFLYKRLPTPTTDKTKIQTIFINMKPEVQPLLSDYATYDLDRFIDKANTIAKVFEIGRKLNTENTGSTKSCPEAELVENKKRTEVAGITLATQNDVIKIIKEELEKFRQSLIPKPNTTLNPNTNNNANSNMTSNPNQHFR